MKCSMDEPAIAVVIDFCRYRTIHSAASGTSKKRRSSHGNLRFIADERMRRRSSRSGEPRPDSHLDIVDCETRATSAISACVTRNTDVRMYRSGFGMREPYANVNNSSRHHDADVHRHMSYTDAMTDDVTEIITELMRITDASQYKLAKLTKVSQPTISKWMTGATEPSMRSWNKIMVFAASRDDTAHIARNHLLSLYGNNEKFLASFLMDALRHRKAS